MPYYLSQYVEIAPRVCAPVGFEVPGWKSIDLRPNGGATLDGGGLNACLLWLPVASADPRLLLIGLEARDSLGPVVRAAVNTRLNTAYTADTVRELLHQILTNPPSGGWRAVRGDRRGVKEILLNGVEFRGR